MIIKDLVRRTKSINKRSKRKIKNIKNTIHHNLKEAITNKENNIKISIGNKKDLKQKANLMQKYNKSHWHQAK